MSIYTNDRSFTCTVTVKDLVLNDAIPSITLDNGKTYSGNKVKSWKITDNFSANNDVAIGSVSSKALNLELQDLTSKEFGSGAFIGVSLHCSQPEPSGTDTEWWFFINSVEWTANYNGKWSASVEAYDAMYFTSLSLGDLADGTSKGLSDIKTICQNVCNHNRYDLIKQRATEENCPNIEALTPTQMDAMTIPGKITIEGVTNTYVDSLTVSKGLSARKMIGRLATAMGKRAYCDADSESDIGRIKFDWISNYSSSIGREDVYDNGFVSKGKKKITYFTTGKVSQGNKSSLGYSTMAIDLPELNSGQLQNIVNGRSLSGLEYELGSVKWRGDPQFKAGNRVTFADASNTTHNTVATKVVSNFDGGFYQQVTASGKTDSDISFEQTKASDDRAENQEEGGGGGGQTFQYITEDSNGVNISGNLTVAGDITGNISLEDFEADELKTNKVEFYAKDSSGNKFTTGYIEARDAYNVGTITPWKLGLAENSIYLVNKPKTDGEEHVFSIDIRTYDENGNPIVGTIENPTTIKSDNFEGNYAYFTTARSFYTRTNYIYNGNGAYIANFGSINSSGFGDMTIYPHTVFPGGIEISGNLSVDTISVQVLKNVYTDTQGTVEAHIGATRDGRLTLSINGGTTKYFSPD